MDRWRCSSPSTIAAGRIGLIAATASDRLRRSVLLCTRIGRHDPAAGSKHARCLRPTVAHIVLRGVEGPLDDGRLFPVSLTFEKAGTVTARGAARRSGLARRRNPKRAVRPWRHLPGSKRANPAPAISLRTEARPDGAGWRVIVDAEEFTFSKEGADKEHIPGVGHGHLYVSGLKLGRLYGPQADIGPLPARRAHGARYTQYQRPPRLCGRRRAGDGRGHHRREVTGRLTRPCDFVCVQTNF